MILDVAGAILKELMEWQVKHGPKDLETSRPGLMWMWGRIERQ